MRNLLITFGCICALLLSNAARAAESVPVTSGKAVAQLVTSHDAAMPGDDIYIALSLRLEPHWHTYWRNAGGPGEPAAMYWDSPDGYSVGEIVWPMPQIVRTGPIINYAFEDRLLLPMKLHISEDAKMGEIITIRAEAAYLVCYQVCLPESAKLSLPLLIGEPVKDGRWSANINRTLKKAPKVNAGFEAAARMKNGQFIVDIKADDLRAGQYKNPYFFPYIQDQIEADDPQNFSQVEDGIRIAMTPGFVLEEGLTEDIVGVIAFDRKTDSGWKRHGVIVSAAADGGIDIGAVTGGGAGAPKPAGIGLMAALIGALLGGMILNLMPCVFPVLSLKALGFAKTAHEDKGKVRRHGWLYTFGVMLSFLALAGALLALKAGGASLGWGFQLQNPVIVGGLALLFFVIALSLFGLFDIGGGLQNTGSGLAQGGGAKGAFFTGVLAVIVATPCTAPFMAGALGFAFAQPALITLIVFAALGFGFAVPFLALSYMPRLLQRLPKPGAWMDIFKQFLAFPMLATAIWLLWVLSHQSGADGIAAALLAMLMAGFAVWLWKRKSGLAKILAVVSIVLGGYFIMSLKTTPATTAQISEMQDAWSPQRVTELRAAGHPVFVDFTARWCVTCKVNEKLVLNRQATKGLFARTNTKVLIADWTNKDKRIADELARHGRSGVPLYLLYPAGADGQLQILPQTLTLGTLEKALEKAIAN